MQLHVPEYIRNLDPYVPGKPIEETQREFRIKKVVKLASNENPLGPSPKAKSAIQAHLRQLHRYPDASGFRLKRALAHHLGPKVSPRSIILGNGSNEVIDHLVRTYCLAGDAIVTQQAAFVAYRICAQVHGVQTLEVPLDRQMKCDVGEILALVRREEKVKIVFLANPNNPTGTYLNAGELQELVKSLSEIRGGSVLLVLDYAYWEYCTAPDLPDPMEFLGRYPNVVVLRTFSKVYGLAGLRVGYGVGTPEVIADLEKVRQPFNINSLGLVGAEAALEDTAFVKRSQAINEKGMVYWRKKLEELEIPYWSSQGNFLLVNVQEGLKQSGPEVHQNCLSRGVIFRPLANYGLQGLIRITIGTQSENKWAVDVLTAARKRKKK